jgi:CheY-like chemotaxis protein
LRVQQLHHLHHLHHPAALTFVKIRDNVTARIIPSFIGCSRAVRYSPSTDNPRQTRTMGGFMRLVPRGPALLCIEDNESHLSLRRAVLEKEGYCVLAAATASQALHMLRQSPVSLVISDHMLQGTTGTDLAREIKINPHIPILIYSGTTPEHLGEADCFMSKTEPTTAFLAMIGDLVNRYWQ